jgi:hypothetical protein
MTDIHRARIELMRIARSLTFVDPGTARRIELVVEEYLDGGDYDTSAGNGNDLFTAMVEAGID